MLIGIFPLLNTDVMHALCATGHGNTVAVVDTSFPSDSVVRHTTHGRLLTIENVNRHKEIDSTLSVFQLDGFGLAAGRMEATGNAGHGRHCPNRGMIS
jgi:L-fucose mutarotase